jgi:hypothetical protein
MEYIETNRIDAMMNINIRMILEGTLNINILVYKSVFVNGTKEVMYSVLHISCTL